MKKYKLLSLIILAVFFINSKVLYPQTYISNLVSNLNIDTSLFNSKLENDQFPNGYYDDAQGLSGAQLKTALSDIIDNHDVQSYSSIWIHFESTDPKPNGKVWDMYSDNPGSSPPYEFNIGDDQCGNFSGEGDCYNREHSFPKSWFNDASPMYTDLFQIVPTDAYVNAKRSNWPFGEVGSASWTSMNGSKVGSNNTLGYSGTVFEPIDEYKGDFARIYFYMATRYEEQIANWENNSYNSDAALDGTSYPCYEEWYLNLLLDWHQNDPVSDKEIDRNNSVYNIQNNRNPFIDHPEYVSMIWVLNQPPPTANFQYSLVSLDDTVQFQDISTLNGGPAIVNWYWNFGDPMSGLENYSSLQNPSHMFSHLGDFDVTLTITDANGISDQITKTLTVNPRPVAGFEWDLSCFGENVQFIDTSSSNYGFITNWWWNFGDPASGAFNSSTAQNPTHAFTAPGTYDVQLVVKAYGYDTIIHQVEVFEGAVADYSFNTPCQGEAVNFIDETIAGDAPIESWFWDFADGNTSTDQNPSHVYQFSGNYLVDLTVTDTNGCSTTVTKNVTIWQGPTAKFNYYSACVGSLTYFIDKSIADGADIISWDWSFGDPASGGLNFSTEQNPSHEYSAPGNYEVILIVEDANGCTDSDTMNIVVEPTPVADFTVASACIGETMSFIDQSYSNGQPIISWYWQFGDGATSTTANPIHTYTSSGNYSVLLLVETTGGCSNEIIKTVTVNAPPTADFQWIVGINNELYTTSFTDLSASTGNALIDTWYWQFGDGETSTLQNPEHSYSQAGEYLVSLLVTDINGCENTIEKGVVITSGAVLSISPTNQFVFTATSFTTIVEIAAVENMGGFELELLFDPALIQANSIQLGDFLGSTEREILPLISNIDNVEGLIEYGVVTLGDTPPGPNGDGVLLTIEWTSTSDLDIESALNLSMQSVQITMPDGTLIPVLIENASVTISPCFIYDFDCDCDVDIIDITSATYHYNTELGDDFYNASFDFDDDGDIDIVDISLIAYHYGWSCDSKSQLKHPLVNIENTNVVLHLEEQTLDNGFMYYDFVIENVQELGSFEFELEYNPDEIEILEIQDAGFLGSTGRQVLELENNTNNRVGVLNYALTTLGAQIKGASGSGTLFKIKCKAHSSSFSPPNLVAGQIVRIDAEPIPFEKIATGISDQSMAVESNRIISVSPNPFKERTRVNYSLEKESHIRFEIYDVFGNYIATPFEGQQKSGVHHLVIKQDNLSSGVYMLFFKSENEVLEVSKIIIEQ